MFSFSASIITLIARLVIHLPRGTILTLSELLGGLAAKRWRRARYIAMANFEKIWPEYFSLIDKERFFVTCMKNQCLTILDLFWFGFGPSSRFERYVKFDTKTLEIYTQSPVIGVTAHFGNWEVLGQAVSLKCQPLYSIAEPLKRTSFNLFLERARINHGQKILYTRGASYGILKAIAKGHNIGVLIDQNVEPGKGGVFVKFFGLPVAVSRIIDVIVRRRKVKIALTLCSHVEDGRCYRIYSRPEFNTEEEFLTQSIMKALEEEIKKAPEQWMWFYKRWKYIPPRWDKNLFPLYAVPEEGFITQQ